MGGKPTQTRDPNASRLSNSVEKGGKHRSRRCAKAPLIHRNRGVFEWLNESNGKLTPALRHLLLKDCIQILKRSNPDRTVIIGLTNWNYISFELDELVLLDDKLF